MLTNQRHFDVVLFDLGGTLIYFNGSWQDATAAAHQAMIQRLRQFGYALDPQAFAVEFSKRLNDYYISREIDLVETPIEHHLALQMAASGHQAVPHQHLRAALDDLYAVTEQIWQLEDDVIPMLEQLRQSGYRLGIISNAHDARDVEILIEQNGIRPYFDVVVISANTGIRKPDPRIFRLALDHYQVAPQRAVMVGDTLNADILGARASGLASVWIPRRAESLSAVADGAPILPDAVINSYDELPVLLENWHLRRME